MISHEHVERIVAVGNLIEVMGCLIVGVIAEDRVINLAGKVIDGPHFVGSYAHAIVAELCLHHVVWLNKDCKSVFLLVRGDGYFVPEVRGIRICAILRGVIILVLHLDKGITQTCSHETVVEYADAVVVLDDVGNGAVGIFKHHVDRMNNTILYGVVLEFEDNLRHTVKLHHGIEVLVDGVRNLYVTLVEVGGVESTVVHVERCIHVVHEVCPGDSVALLLGQVFHTVESLLLEEFCHHVV